MTQKAREVSDFQIGVLAGKVGELTKELDDFKEEDRASHDRLETNFKAEVVELRGAVEKVNKKLSIVIDNMKWYKHLFMFLRAVLLTLAFAAAFKFGDIKTMWATFWTGS